MLTIGIPTVERLGYLEELLSTLQVQTDKRFEIVVSQDFDRPDVTRWCEDNARKYNFRFKKNTCNAGLAGNWNSIVQAAQGAYTAILGDDDRVLPTFVAETLKAAESEADVVFCEQNTIDENGCSLVGERWNLALQYGRDSLTSGIVADPLALAWRNAIPMTGSIIRTDLLRKYPFDLHLNTPEIEFFVRALNQHSRVIYIPIRLVEFRMHRSSATSAGLRNDRLAELLVSMSVPPHIEQQKCKLLRPIVTNAISIALSAGNAELAGRMVRSNYGPKGFKGVYLRALVALGTPVGAAVHRAVKSIKNWRGITGSGTISLQGRRPG
jgi:glycosyltransferase involved in cell wall biosynthesis